MNYGLQLLWKFQVKLSDDVNEIQRVASQFGKNAKCQGDAISDFADNSKIKQKQTQTKNPI